MAKDRVERRLDQLKGMRLAGPTDATVAEVRKSLADPVNVIVAKAAGLVNEWQSRTLLADLAKAFDRLLAKPEADPQCWGKNALCKALKDLEFSESDLYLRGLLHRQCESTWGGKTDTAGVLRGTCALALVQCIDLPRDEILKHLVNAVTEPESRVRSDAARALEQVGGRDVTLLLRLKARAGDQEVRVTGQVLESLLQIEGASGIPFVAEFLTHVQEDVREEAALALGASRLPEGLDLLKKEWLKSRGRAKGEILLRALSSSRQDSALEFLLEQVRTGPVLEASQALYALELHRDSDEITDRIKEAVSTREEELRSLFMQRFRA